MPRAPTDPNALALYRAIVFFFAATTVVTEGRARANGLQPLCDDDETKFLAEAIEAEGRHKGIELIDPHRLYMLFQRAARSPCLDLRHAGMLHKALDASLQELDKASGEGNGTRRVTGDGSKR